MERNVFDMPEPKTTPMTLEDAKQILKVCTRFESRDHSFGDREIYWEIEGELIAEGYFSRDSRTVFMLLPEEVSFTGSDAVELSRCAKIVNIGRNDETGPDEYRGA